MHTETHRSLQLGKLESWCPSVGSCGSRSLAGVTIGSQMVSEASLGDDEAVLLVIEALPFKMVWLLYEH